MAFGHLLRQLAALANVRISCPTTKYLQRPQGNPVGIDSQIP